MLKRRPLPLCLALACCLSIPAIAAPAPRPPASPRASAPAGLATPQPAPDNPAGGASSGAAPSVEALTIAIDDLLDRIDTAVLAGNQQAYLDLIDHHDPVFVQEQVNWAKDLARGLPAAFEMALVGEPAVGTGYDARPDITAMVEMRFTPGQKEGDAQPWEPRVLRYRARFVAGTDDPRPAASDDDGGDVLPLLYAGEDWDVLEDGTTRVMFPPKYRALARVVIDALPAIRLHVDAQMQSDNAVHTQVVKIYGDQQHLQASIYLNYTAGLSGWNEPGESIKTLGRDARGPDVMDGLLAHEYGHAATFWLGEHANEMQWWILEGIADFVSHNYRDDKGQDGVDPARPRQIPEATDQTIRNWARQNNLPQWNELADFYNFDPRLTGHVYRQGEHMVAYVTEHFGVPARNSWLRTMAGGATLDDATRSALGIPFAELDQQWRESVKPTEAPDEPREDAAQGSPGGSGV